MVIQQRDNETLAACVHQFQTEAKRCSFNSDTAPIHIFIKGLQHAHTTTAQIFKWDPQSLSEVIKVIKRFNAAQQAMATLTSSNST